MNIVGKNNEYKKKQQMLHQIYMSIYSFVLTGIYEHDCAWNLKSHEFILVTFVYFIFTFILIDNHIIIKGTLCND